MGAHKLFAKKRRYEKSVGYCSPHNACIVDKCFELKLIFMFETHGEQYVMTMEITKKE